MSNKLNEKLNSHIPENWDKKLKNLENLGVDPLFLESCKTRILNIIDRHGEGAEEVVANSLNRAEVGIEAANSRAYAGINKLIREVAKAEEDAA